MDISRIEVENFMVHDKLVVTLPPKGLVVVTGPNGTGKSTMVEAVAAAVWGRSLRGLDGWRVGQPGSVSVLLRSGARVDRTCDRGGRKRVAWTPAGAAEAEKHDTATKAQGSVSAALGDFERWRRTHVFSSQDAAHFSVATDAERKVLIEGLLGLGAFDSALDRAVADLRIQEAAHQKVEQDVRVLQVSYDADMRRMRDAVLHHSNAVREAEQSDPGVDPTPELDSAKAAQAAQVVEPPGSAKMPEVPPSRAPVVETLRLAVAAERTAWDVLSEAKSAVSGARRSQASVMGGRCPVCDQSTEVLCADRAQMVASAELVQSDAEATVRLATEAVAAVQAELQEIDSQHQIVVAEAVAKALSDARQRQESAQQGMANIIRLERMQVAWRSAVQNQIRALKAVTLAKSAVSGFASDASIAEESLSVAQDTLRAASIEVGILRAVREVLGLRGARARVLAEALRGLESVANGWMSRLFSHGAALRLSATSELKSGAVVGAIGLEVEGVGQGGYRSLSGGERRRVDVALLLALAEVASLAAGSTPGTLFIDEVFDALDAEGIAAVQRELGALASDRCVVLISHSPDLVRDLKAVARVTFGA